MLFTDIEGSTAMLSRLGDRYGEALSAHRILLRAAFAACHGRAISTEGDSFFVVFESAGEAVSCCLAAQRALAAHDWAEGEAVWVRMGVHTGRPTRTRTTTSAWTCTGRPGSLRRRMVASW
jgi:class 3 adenylate cyclase